jgi:DNA-binding ferritin-like protein
VSGRVEVPTDFSQNSVEQISNVLHELLADVFDLYIKTKKFHSI